MGLLSCRGLARRPWFENVDLELTRGEIVVLTGPSGAGKSLLLRAIADLDPTDAGEVELDGERRESLAPHVWRSRVVYVQPGAVRLVGTVSTNLASIRELAIHAGRGAGDEAAAAVGLLPEADAEQLSSGEGQRLALVRALGIDPSVLLLDEPTAALDPEAARKGEASVQAFTAGGGSALWVSHDPGLSVRLGARHLSWEELTAS